MKSIFLKSPAKLNLFLKVTGKRPDGYHNLITLFERIDLCDDISLALNRQGKIRIFSNHPQMPKGSKNLMYKVAQMLKKDFQCPWGVDITIKKRIPVAAGLGGGSSNAATTLLGLNRLWKLSLTRQEIVHYAQKIGSDVPFFVYDASWALGTQRGDAIKRLFLKKKLWHVLVVPKLKVYTYKVFGALNLKLTKKKADVNMLHRALGKSDLPAVSHLLLNDLETTIVHLHPNLLKIKEKISKSGALNVLFSGSGPSLFGLARSKAHAEQLAALLNKDFSQVFVVQTL